jgi:cobalamin biosynthesis protein CobT
VDNKKEKFEDFKTAISSTVRSISNSEKIEVSFGNQTPKSEKNSIKLPELNQINNKLNFDQIRAMADSKSLNFRFSNNNTFKQYEPSGNISKKLYEISEKIRCEKI